MRPNTTILSHSGKLEMEDIWELEQRQQAEHQLVLFTARGGSSDDG